MERFTYTRTGQALKNQLFSLMLLAGVDLAGWAVGLVLLPRPWGVWVGLGGLLLTGLVYWFLTGVLRTSHVLNGERLHLQMGRHRLVLQREDICGVTAMTAPLPRSVNPAGISHWGDTDTLYVLADQRRLVALTLARPHEMKVPSQGLCQFTKVVLSLDEPERFCAALAGRREAGPGADRTVTAGAAAAVSATAAPRAAGPHEAHGDEALRLIGLVKRYGDFTAVGGIDLAVRRGEVLAFLGANGAGKSTAIRMATGLLRPTAGRVLVEGRDLWAEGAPVRRLLGYVPDVPLLHESLTAREFLWMMAGLYSLPEGEGRRRAAELLAQVGLERWGDHQIRSFSLGMKRKLAIATALVHRPRVLLLDEVTNGLDPRASREVKDFIKAAAREGAAVLLTTHILEVAEELAHRIAVIHAGRICAVGDLAECV